MKKSRLIITETDESIEIIIPPPRFHSHMTIVCIVCDLILLFPLLLIAYGFYYVELVYKIALLIFSIPWLGFGVIINIILIALFIDKTLISVNSEKSIFLILLKKNRQSLFRSKLKILSV